MIRHDSKNDKTLSYNDITAICQDGLGRIWCGTFNGGLNALDTVTEKVTRYLAEPGNKDWLKNNNIFSIKEDGSHEPVVISSAKYLALPELTQQMKDNLVPKEATDLIFSISEN